MRDIAIRDLDFGQVPKICGYQPQLTTELSTRGVTITVGLPMVVYGTR